MTLCIAEATNNQIFILSDTKITSNIDRSSPSNYALKTLFLSHNCALCFCGDPDIAQSDVRGFQDRYSRVTEFSGAIEYFRRRSGESINSYLLSFAGPKRIFKLDSGRVEEKRIAWIGDYEAYKFYRDRYKLINGKNYFNVHAFGPIEKDVQNISRSIGRFEEVCASAEVPSVGGFYSLALSEGGSFYFSLLSHHYMDADSHTIDQQGAKLMSQTGENKDYFLDVWAPKDKGVTSVAYVYRKQRLCYVYFQRKWGFSFDYAKLVIPEGLKISEASKRLVEELKEATGIEFSPHYSMPISADIPY